MPTRLAAISATSPFGTGTGTVPYTYTNLFAIFDASTASGVTISQDGLSVTNAASGLSVFGGVQGFVSASQVSGKYYYEMTWTTMPAPPTGTDNGGIAFGPAGLAGNEYVNLALGDNGDCPDGVMVGIGGYLIFYGTSSNTFLTSTGLKQGDVIGVAVDLNNMAIWFKCVGGPDSPNQQGWNGDFGADPATNIGGISLHGLTSFSPYVTHGQNQDIADSTITANFGATPFAISPDVPLGFELWPVT